MQSIGIKSSGKIRASSPKVASKLGSDSTGSGIKKAIDTTKPSQEAEANQNNEELEQDLIENETEVQVKEETELEKKNNLDKLLKRGLTTKEGKTDENKKIDKEAGKEIDKEWLDNSSAKEKDGKRTDILTDGDALKDVLKNDKDSIAKKYPGIDRPGPSSSGSPKAEAKPQAGDNNVNGSSGGSGNGSDGNSSLNNGGNSGSNGNGSGSSISKLSDGGSSNNSHNHSNSGSFNGGNTIDIPNPNNGQGGGARDFPRNDNNGGGNIHQPGDHGHSGDAHVAHTKFEALYTEGHLQGKVIQASSSQEAQRITAALKDIGAFKEIQQNGNSIRLSGFNAELSHDIHEAHGKIIGDEFQSGNIDKVSFEGVKENIAGNLTSMLETKANEIGSTDHNIASNCKDGTCEVSVERNQNQIREQNQESPEPEVNKDEQIA